MINLTVVKKLALATGTYRLARWLERHILFRSKLNTYQNSLSFYSKLIRPNDLVFDVGANKGEKTEVFLNLGARVVAFEPQSDCMRELKARCRHNEKLITVEIALGSKVEQATFYIRSYRNVSSLNRDWEGDIESSLTVPVTILDKAIKQYGLPKFCKIDVEGSELEVIKGLSRRIPILSFEYHYREPYIQKTIDSLNYLADIGKLSINITQYENLKFTLPVWKVKDDFLEFFLNRLPYVPEYHYGDIYVKINNSSG